jgi:hypothetical protein
MPPLEIFNLEFALGYMKTLIKCLNQDTQIIKAI